MGLTSHTTSVVQFPGRLYGDEDLGNMVDLIDWPESSALKQL